MLNELITTIRKRTLFQTGDKLNLIVTNPYLKNPISTGLMTLNDDTNPVISLGTQLTNMLTSNEQISLENCNFHVTVIAMPRGQGGAQKIVNLNDDIHLKRCITRIKMMIIYVVQEQL